MGIRSYFRRAGWLLGLSLLCWCLGGCSSWGGPPDTVVEQALELQLQQAQQLLASQLQASTLTPLSSSDIHIERARSLTLDADRVYQISGHYTLRGRYHDRRYRQRQAPFELYLKPLTEKGWAVLSPSIDGVETAERWHALGQFTQDAQASRS